MATTTPKTWPDTLPILTEDHVKIITRWYVTSLGDEDKAGTMEDANFYEGWRAATEAVLNLLHGIEIQ